MEHHGAASHHQQQTNFGGSGHLAAVLHEQLLEDAIVLGGRLDALVHLLAPPVQFQVKGVELGVPPLHGRHDGHQDLALELDAPLQVQLRLDAAQLAAHVPDVAVGREGAQATHPLALQALQLEHDVGLFFFQTPETLAGLLHVGSLLEAACTRRVVVL